MIERTLFLTAVTQRMEPGSWAVTHTLAELSDELLQDTQGFKSSKECFI